MVIRFEVARFRNRDHCINRCGWESEKSWLGWLEYRKE